MKLRLLVSAALVMLAALVVVDAFAEDAPASPPAEKTEPAKAEPAPAPQVGPQKFYLEVDAADLDIISKGLIELPFKTANPLLLKLNGQLQVQEQLKAAADKALTDATDKAKKRK